MYVIYNIHTWQILTLKDRRTAYYDTYKAASTIRTRMINSGEINIDDWVVDSLMQYNASMPMVETYNLLDPERKPIKIRACDKGTCCDPATERYHSM